MRILLVEDSESDAFFVTRLLERPVLQIVYEVVHCEKLARGLEELEAGSWDVVLLDLGLAESDGMETFQRFQQVADCAIVVLSGMSDEAVAMEAVRLGAQDYLMKEDLNNRFLERSICYAVERYTSQSRLESALEKAEAANRAKGEFLAVMSHEFRTPMNGILGGLELMESEMNSEELEGVRKMMRECAVNQLELINDVLDISRYEAGKLEVETQPFVLKDVLDSVVGVLGHRAAQKGIELVVSVEPSVPGSLVSDHRRLRQVLLNLVGNAVKFTEKGEVRLSVFRSGKDKLGFAVEDTGIGIAEGMLEQVFDAFTQVDSSYSRRFQGSGLGLSICKRLVSVLGGDISVESVLGVGSKFSFDIRMSVDKEASEASFPPLSLVDTDSPSAYEDLPATRYPLSILLVDDDPHSLMIEEMVLVRMGYSPICADSGEEAVRLARENDFDLIMMDIQMPCMDGLDTAREIRRLSESSGRRVFISAVTATAALDDRQSCMEAGMDMFLSKPVAAEDLEPVLEIAYNTKTPASKRLATM